MIFREIEQKNLNEGVVNFVRHDLMEDKNKIDSIMNMNFLPSKKK